LDRVVASFHHDVHSKRHSSTDLRRAGWNHLRVGRSTNVVHRSGTLVDTKTTTNLVYRWCVFTTPRHAPACPVHVGRRRRRARGESHQTPAIIINIHSQPFVVLSLYRATPTRRLGYTAVTWSRLGGQGSPLMHYVGLLQPDRRQICGLDNLSVLPVSPDTITRHEYDQCNETVPMQFMTVLVPWASHFQC